MIDGFAKEIYEKYRVLGNRGTVYANVQFLLEERKRRSSGSEIMVQFIEMADNVKEFEDYAKYWLGLGATVKLCPDRVDNPERLASFR